MFVTASPAAMQGYTAVVLGPELLILWRWDLGDQLLKLY